MIVGRDQHKGDLSDPPEIEVELVKEPASGPAETQAPATPAKKKTAGVRLAVSAGALLAILAAGYFGVTQFLKSRNGDRAVSPVAEAPSEAAAPAVEAAADPSPAASAASPPPAEIAAMPPASPVAQPANSGDALERLQAEADAAAAREASGLSPAVPAPLPAAPTEGPEADVSATAPVPQPTEDPPVEPIEGIAAASAPPPSAPASADTGALAGELAALRASFEAETRRLADALAAETARAETQGAEIAALRAELAQRPAAAPAPLVEAEPPPKPLASADGSAAVPSLVLLALARAVERGGPYKVELARAERLAPGAPAIQKLRIDADEGAPTLPALKARFPAAARAALAADAGKAGGLWGRFSAGAAELVSVRPAGPTAGARPAAVLSRMEAALIADDAARMLAEAKALQGPAREALAPLLDDAARFAGAQDALAELNAQLIERSGG
jgi:Meckel syndrome type 1 protein